MPVKVPQPHGGALNSGGTPGNRGGPGSFKKKITNSSLKTLAGEGGVSIEKILVDHVKSDVWQQSIAATD